jgi:triphosphatase
MVEFEVKLQVPAGVQARVARAFAAAPVQGLRAQYADTVTGQLAAQGIVVRMRKEGPRWVQTAKAPGANAQARLEHNVDISCPVRGAVPVIDLTRHAGTPLEEHMRKALDLSADAAFPPLVVTFETDVQRRIIDQITGRGHTEIAFDVGRVRAGRRSVAICEVEFELKSGAASATVSEAGRWAKKYGLWISAIAKSQHGARLCSGTVPDAATARKPDYPESATLHEARTAILHSCLDHIIANASEVVAGSVLPEHVHQLRIGIRRLRTGMRELGVAGQTGAVRWEKELRRVFGILGEHRDRALVALQQPQLRSAGSPPVDMSAGPEALSAAVLAAVRSPGFQATLLELMACAHRVPRASGKHPVAGHPEAKYPEARKLAVARLRKLRRQITRDADQFESLGAELQHGVRKRVKRLRYLAELARPLFAAREVDDYLKHLKPVQDRLGAYNDGLMAQAFYQRIARRQPGAWFAAGWLAAQRAGQAEACQRELGHLRHIDVFW